MTDVINELILQTRRKRPVTSVVVTHELRTVHKVADRVVMMQPFARMNPGDPQLIYDGPPAGLAASDDARGRALLAGGEGADLFVTLGGQPHLRQNRLGLVIHRPEAARRLEPVRGDPPLALHGEPDVFKHAQIQKQIVALKRIAEAEPSPRVNGQPGDIPAIEIHAARGRREFTGNQLEECGLARAVGADDGPPLAGLDLQRHVHQRRQPTVVLVQALHLDLAHARFPAARRARPTRPCGANNTNKMNTTPITVSQRSV